MIGRCWKENQDGLTLAVNDPIWDVFSELWCTLVSGKPDARLLKRHHCVRVWVCCFSGPFRKKKWWNVYLMSYRGDSKRPREDLDPQPGTYLMSVFSGTDRRWPLVVWTEHEASYHHPVAWGPRGAQGPVSTKSRGTRIQRTERSRGPERGPRGPKDPKTQRTRGGPRRSGEPGEPWGPRGPKGPWGPDTSFFPLLFP